MIYIYNDDKMEVDDWYVRPSSFFWPNPPLSHLESHLFSVEGDETDVSYDLHEAAGGGVLRRDAVPANKDTASIHIILVKYPYK